MKETTHIDVMQFMSKCEDFKILTDYGIALWRFGGMQWGDLIVLDIATVRISRSFGSQ